jgi:branched-chain amino acid transport system ATP-binding protein
MLTLKDVHTYYGKSHILQGVSLEIPAGAVVALLGRNGVGKTTTMRTIMGLTPPARGAVMLEGEDVTRLPPYRKAQLGIGYVPENRQVFPRLSVLENLRIGLELKNWSEAQKRAALDLVYASFPRLKERETQAGATLSGGEQQMLAMARAVATRPKLILLDEPSEGLMPSMVREIERIIEWMAKDLGITILLIEQDYRMSLRVSALCYVMAKGRIIHSGPSADLAGDRAMLAECLGVH